MRKLYYIFLASGLALISCQPSGDSSSEGEVALSTYNDSLSYSLGAGFADNLIQEGLDSLINLKAVFAGLSDNVKGDKGVLMDEEACKSLLTDHLRERQMAKMGAQLKANAEAEQVFMADNKQKEGVQETESGLQYKIITPGTGKQPGMEDQVRVHYTGRLLDGQVFDSSVQRGQPAEFPVAGVIPGWTEALQLMKEGAKWEIYIPSRLAYGTQGAGSIPPGAAITFEVELIAVL